MQFKLDYNFTEPFRLARSESTAVAVLSSVAIQPSDCLDYAVMAWALEQFPC
jgi:hypothetical protein